MGVQSMVIICITSGETQICYHLEVARQDVQKCAPTSGQRAGSQSRLAMKKAADSGFELLPL